MIDSLEVQNIVGFVLKFGLSYLPENYVLLAPVVSAIVTALTAAAIRSFQLKQIHNFHSEEIQELKNKIKEYETKI